MAFVTASSGYCSPMTRGSMDSSVLSPASSGYCSPTARGSMGSIAFDQMYQGQGYVTSSPSHVSITLSSPRAPPSTTWHGAVSSCQAAYLVSAPVATITRMSITPPASPRAAMEWTPPNTGSFAKEDIVQGSRSWSPSAGSFAMEDIVQGTRSCGSLVAQRTQSTSSFAREETVQGNWSHRSLHVPRAPSTASLAREDSLQGTPSRGSLAVPRTMRTPSEVGRDETFQGTWARGSLEVPRTPRTPSVGSSAREEASQGTRARGSREVPSAALQQQQRQSAGSLAPSNVFQIRVSGNWQDLPEEQDLQLKKAYLSGFPKITYCDAEGIYEADFRRMVRTTAGSGEMCELSVPFGWRALQAKKGGTSRAFVAGPASPRGHAKNASSCGGGRTATLSLADALSQMGPEASLRSGRTMSSASTALPAVGSTEMLPEAKQGGSSRAFVTGPASARGPPKNASSGGGRRTATLSPGDALAQMGPEASLRSGRTMSSASTALPAEGSTEMPPEEAAVVETKSAQQVLDTLDEPLVQAVEVQTTSPRPPQPVSPERAAALPRRAPALCPEAAPPLPVLGAPSRVHRSSPLEAEEAAPIADDARGDSATCQEAAAQPAGDA